MLPSILAVHLVVFLGGALVAVQMYIGKNQKAFGYACVATLIGAVGVVAALLILVLFSGD